MFADQVNAQNQFVSDVEAEIIGRYGALSERGMASRYYFLVGEDGTILWKNVTGGLIPVEALLEELGDVLG